MRAALSPRDKALLQEVKRRVVSIEPNAHVLLYGSVARGTATPDSDYDVLVLTPHKLSTAEEDEIYRAIYELELSGDTVVSTMFYSVEEWNSPVVKASPYHKNVVRESVAL